MEDVSTKFCSKNYIPGIYLARSSSIGIVLDHLNDLPKHLSHPKNSNNPVLRILFFYNMNHREILARAKKNSYLNDSMSLLKLQDVCSFLSRPWPSRP